MDFEADVFASWTRHMRRGDFAAAWEISDAVLRSRAGISCRHLPRHMQYVWDGTSLEAKRVLIRCYHGLGDTIQFIRYAPLVKAIAAQVIVSAPAELIALLQMMDGIDRLFPLDAAEPSYDVDVEVMELPHVFRTTIQTIPAQIPYFHVDAASLPRDRQLAVGIVWEAGDWDLRRSIPYSLIAPLAEIQGIELYVLQHGPGLAKRNDGLGMVLSSDNLFETARRLRALDLLITVDTMAAHLAGALGVRVWTLLHADADWRWLEQRRDSPWYPTMRLFRQERSGKWAPVIAAVSSELDLARFSSARRSGKAQAYSV